MILPPIAQPDLSPLDALPADTPVRLLISMYGNTLKTATVRADSATAMIRDYATRSQTIAVQFSYDQPRRGVHVPQSGEVLGPRGIEIERMRQRARMAGVVAFKAAA